MQVKEIVFDSRKGLLVLLSLLSQELFLQMLTIGQKRSLIPQYFTYMSNPDLCL